MGGILYEQLKQTPTGWVLELLVAQIVHAIARGPRQLSPGLGWLV